MQGSSSGRSSLRILYAKARGLVWQPTPVFLPEKSHGQRRLAEAVVHEVTRVGHDSVTKPPNHVSRGGKVGTHTRN